MPASTPADGSVRVRFAPSPTGALHMGSALVALANAAFARARSGAFVLRIDDTDLARSEDRDVDELLRLLTWLGVTWDEGPLRQHERAPLHRAALERLLDDGVAYPCFCGDARLAELRDQQQRAGLPPRYDGRCRALTPEAAERALADGAPHVLRFAVPEGRDVVFDDLVRGAMQVPAGSFGDPILCRADGSPGYLLASVVDDIELGITHVIRGEDHLTNTARQVLLFEALAPDAEPPAFAHLPLLRDEDGRKLSKRDPLGTLDEVADEGFLPVSVRRYLAELLGQGPVDLLAADVELELARIPTGAPRVDRARLESLGREDMAACDPRELAREVGIVVPDAGIALVAELAAASPSHVALRGELRLVFDGPGLGDLPIVIAFAAPDEVRLERFGAALGRAQDALAELALRGSEAADWPIGLLARYRSEGAAAGFAARDLLKPLRVALTGATGGPGLELVLAAIGAPEAHRRVQIARMVATDLLAERAGGNDAADG